MHIPRDRDSEQAKKLLAFMEEHPNQVISYGGVRSLAEWPAERELLLAELKTQAGMIPKKAAGIVYDWPRQLASNDSLYWLGSDG